MKIEKIKNKKLIEAIEETTEVTDIDPQNSTVGEVADAIQDTIEAVSDGELTVSDANAKAVAKEVTDAADDIDADTLAFDDSIAETQDEALGLQNRLTDALDTALRTSRQNKHLKEGSIPNVLIIGLPGSGKTSIVYDWAKSKGDLNVFSVNAADPDLKNAIYGMLLRDITVPDANVLAKARSAFLDKLDKPNSILYVDELNRAPADLRAALLDLITAHYIRDIDAPSGKRTFNNLLFSIATINPGGLRSDALADKLSDAEKSRFNIKVTGFDSDPKLATAYFKAHYDKLISKLDKADPDYLKDLETLLRKKHLAVFITTHPRFKFDTKEDLDDLYEEDRTLLNQRALTDGISLDMPFKDWVEYGSGFLDRDIQMLLDILSEYVEPSFEELLQDNGIEGIDLSNNKTETKTETETEESDTDNDEDEYDLDDEEDTDFFSANTSGKPMYDAQETQQRLVNIASQLFK